MENNRQTNPTKEIILVIDGKTPTINHLHGHNKWGAFYVKPEAKVLKQKIFKSISNQLKEQDFVHSEWLDRLLDVSVVVHEDWWTTSKKINNPKRKDIANREKFLIDTIFDAMKLEDSRIWKHTLQKKEDNEFKAIVTIRYYTF